MAIQRTITIGGRMRKIPSVGNRMSLPPAPRNTLRCWTVLRTSNNSSWGQLPSCFLSRMRHYNARVLRCVLHSPPSGFANSLMDVGVGTSAAFVTTTRTRTSSWRAFAASRLPASRRLLLLLALVRRLVAFPASSLTATSTWTLQRTTRECKRSKR